MGKFHGQRSLAGYSPWGCKESDTTERLTLEYIMLTLNKAVTKEQILYDSTCMKYLIKFIETESRMVGGGAWGCGWGSVLTDAEFPLAMMKKVLSTDKGDGYITCECT